MDSGIFLFGATTSHISLFSPSSILLTANEKNDQFIMYFQLGEFMRKCWDLDNNGFNFVFLWLLGLLLKVDYAR